LEWIPFEKFEMVKYIDNGGFGCVYSALWMEAPRWIWDDDAQEWTQADPMNVALKRLDNSQNISSSYIDQVQYLSFPFIGKKGPA
jgi:predicted Zn-dependent protease